MEYSLHLATTLHAWKEYVQLTRERPALRWWANGGRFGAKPVIGDDQWAGSFILPHVGRWAYSIAVLARRLPEVVGFWLFEPRGGGSG